MISLARGFYMEKFKLTKISKDTLDLMESILYKEIVTTFCEKYSLDKESCRS